MLRYRIKGWIQDCIRAVRMRIALMFKLELPKPDLFQQKHNEISGFVDQFTSAVNVLNSAMNNLISINDSIDEKISEVDEDQRRLTSIRENLTNAREKNNKVISNFRALLGSD